MSYLLVVVISSSVLSGGTMSEPEEDYLSDSVLNLAKKADELSSRKPKKSKVAPPVVQQKSLREKEREVLAAGLAKPIERNNIGFAMLEKMGYRFAGFIGKGRKLIVETIDKDRPWAAADLPYRSLFPLSSRQVKFGLLSQFIYLRSRTDRVGLGIAEKRQREEQLEEIGNLQKIQRESQRADSFKAQKSVQFTQKQLVADLYKCRTACETLDKRKGIVNARYWNPDVELEPVKAEQNRLQQLAQSVEQLHSDLVDLLEYLRTVHFYCFWCGAEYNDAEDLTQNCPGTEKDLH